MDNKTDNKRIVKNYFINPAFQTKLILYFIAISLAITGLMIFSINIYMSEIFSHVSNIPGIPFKTLDAIQLSLDKIFKTSLTFLALGLATTILFGLIISHRIAGPMYAILQYIDRLLASDFSEKRNLRPHDELAPIMYKLHLLADKLSAKK